MITKAYVDSTILQVYCDSNEEDQFDVNVPDDQER